MKPEIKEKWIEALVSGDYTQGREALRSADNAYCCLGVLCDLHRKATKKKGWDEFDPDDYGYYYAGENKTLPPTVAVWAGIDPMLDLGEIELESKRTKYNSLAEANDGGRNFKQIASLIERYF